MPGMGLLKSRRALLSLFGLLFTLGFGAWLRGQWTGVSQPIAFPHKTHIEKAGMGCEDCHPGVKTSFHAGLPGLDLCLNCHESPQGNSKEEAKIRALAKISPRPTFAKLFRFPNHVFYSHRRHVGLAKLECAGCHGAIAGTLKPPTHPLKKISMDFCLDCHRLKGATTDCIACHR